MRARRPIGGLDEAGRGSILGPLVVAGVSADAAAIRRLGKLGVKDSKLLTREKRASLYEQIGKLCEVVSFVPIPPAEVDHYVRTGTRRRKLNYLEAIYMARVIRALGVEKVFIDAPDTNTRKFASELGEMLHPCPKIIAEHKADRNYVVVSAASIVAKVERDAAVERLRREHGDFGSGYPSDEETISFLRNWVDKEGGIPPFARSSWKTWNRILATKLPV